MEWLEQYWLECFMLVMFFAALGYVHWLDRLDKRRDIWDENGGGA